MELLEILCVHEVIVGAVRIKKFHGLLINIDPVDGIGGAEAVLEHGAGAQIAQLGLDECAQIARSAVLNAEDGMKVVVVLDDHAWTHLCCWNCHYSSSPEILIVCRLAAKRASPRAAWEQRQLMIVPEAAQELEIEQHGTPVAT